MPIRSFAPASAAVLLATAGLGGQSASTAASGYQTPPQEIVESADAEPLPAVTVSPARGVLAIAPHQTHGFAARESNLHVIAETPNWLDKYVKTAPPRKGTGGRVFR